MAVRLSIIMVNGGYREKYHLIDYLIPREDYELIWIEFYGEAKLIVTNDSGPFHIAVALNKKVACISNGDNYGRFTPYPKEMNTSSIVIYPDELLEINSEEERLRQFCKHSTVLDINSIDVATVYHVIKKNLLN